MTRVDVRDGVRVRGEVRRDPTRAFSCDGVRLPIDGTANHISGPNGFAFRVEVRGGEFRGG